MPHRSTSTALLGKPVQAPPAPAPIARRDRRAVLDDPPGKPIAVSNFERFNTRFFPPDP
jgi:hypothetical protein